MKQTLLLLCFMLPGVICAQRTYTLNQLFEMAEQNNTRLRVHYTAQQVAHEAAAHARSQRLPDLDVQLGLSYNGRGGLTDRDFSHYRSIYIPEFGNTFAFRATEVVYAGGAISAAIQLGEMGEQMADLDMKKNRQEVRFLIIGHYLDLYKCTNTLQVLDEHIALTEKVLQNMRVRYEQGAALQNDITRYELQLQQLQLQKEKVTDARSILNYQLCTEVGLPDSSMVMPESHTLENPLAEDEGEAYWQQQATLGHYGLQQAALAHTMSEKEVTLSRAAKLPHVSLFAADNLNGPITIEIPAINKNFNYWYVGVGVQYSLSSLYKNNHDVRRAREKAVETELQLEEAREGVRLGVQAATVNYHTAFTELHTQQKSVELAAQNYAVVNNRYENGLAILTDMLDASHMKLSADLQLVNARINLLYSYYNLKYVAHQL